MDRRESASLSHALIPSEVRHGGPRRTDSGERGRCESLERIRRVHHRAAYHRQYGFDVLDLLFRNAEVVSAEDGEVGVLAGSDAALDRFLLAEPACGGRCPLRHYRVQLLGSWRAQERYRLGVPSLWRQRMGWEACGDHERVCRHLRDGPCAISFAPDDGKVAPARDSTRTAERDPPHDRQARTERHDQPGLRREPAKRSREGHKPEEHDYSDHEAHPASVHRSPELVHCLRAATTEVEADALAGAGGVREVGGRHDDRDTHR